MTDTITRPYDQDADLDDEQLAHIVIPASKVTEAYILGTPVTALCGKEWVPHLDPEPLPLCQTCARLHAAM